MRLHDIVRAMGGELYANGYRASIPAPGHSSADRSVSLLLSGGRVLIHSFGEASWQAVRDDLLERGLIDNRGAPAATGSGVARTGYDHPTKVERNACAKALWDEAFPIRPGTPAWRYIRERVIQTSPAGIAALRSHAAAPVSAYRRNSITRTALVARIDDEGGDLTGVEITYLTAGGSRANDMRLSRKTIGSVPSGSAVRLSEAGPALVVGEGVFTTLSAMEHFGLPGWALLSTSNMAKWSPPSGVELVVIAGDRGAAGEAAASTLLRQIRRRGAQAVVRLPPASFGDWNEVAQAACR